jgi:hypothetical protein
MAGSLPTNQEPQPGFEMGEKAECDIGLDFSLFNHRLTGTTDYYNRNTTDPYL